MFRLPFAARRSDPSPALSDAQRLLVETKFELLQRASEDFTEDKLLHLQGDAVRLWTTACTAELRRKITSVAARRTEISLIDFPLLQCLSLQCRPPAVETPVRG